jgi:phosphate transport system permease protein
MAAGNIQISIVTREMKNKIFLGIVIAMSALTVVPIVFIVSKIVITGIGQINLNFFISDSPDSLQAMTAISNNEPIPGGIANGITGTLIIVFMASLMAIPAGMMTGIYLYENQSSRYSALIRNIAEILQGVPFDSLRDNIISMDCKKHN